MIKKKKREFLDEELREYRAIPAKKKLEFLARMNAFLAKVTPPKSKRLWKKLKQEGY